MSGQKDIRKIKRRSTSSKIIEKIVTNCFKIVRGHMWAKDKPTLGQIIFGIKCDRDNAICFGVNKIKLDIK